MEDYWAETPECALYGAKEGGFNLTETQFTKAKRTREQAQQDRKAKESAHQG